MVVWSVSVFVSLTITSYRQSRYDDVKLTVTGAAVADICVSMTVTGDLTNSAINWNFKKL